MLSLHPYQEEGIRLTGEAIRHGARAVCFVMGTGLGKTYTVGTICARHVVKIPNAKVLWLAHREELVGQAFDELTGLGLSCGVIQSVPVREVNPHRPVQIASIQTLLARKIVVPGVTLCVHDEAHRGPSDEWSSVPLHYKATGAVVIGPTATPVRGDGRGLGEIYDDLVCPITVRQAIDRGYLVPFTIERPPYALKSGQIAQSPYDAWREYAYGRKTIVFSGNITAGEQHLAEFRAGGVRSGMVTGAMEAGERRATLEAYQRGDLDVLVNVGILIEGYNDPPTSCVILARRVGSLALYLQICGRALRTSRQTGKTDAMLLDLHGSSWDHGPPDEEHAWELEGEAVKKRKAKLLDVRFCAVCQEVLEDDSTICPGCGVARALPEAPEVLGIKLVRYARKRREGDDQRAESLRRWLKDAEDQGYKPGWAYRKYEAVYNCKVSAAVRSLLRHT